MDLVKRKRQQSDEEEEKPQRAKTNAITTARGEVDEDMVDSHYTRPHWARATTETPMKIGEKKETVVALIDHGSEINLIVEYKCIMYVFTLSSLIAQVRSISVISIKGSCPK